MSLDCCRGEDQAPGSNYTGPPRAGTASRCGAQLLIRVVGTKPLRSKALQCSGCCRPLPVRGMVAGLEDATGITLAAAAPPHARRSILACLLPVPASPPLVSASLHSAYGELGPCLGLWGLLTHTLHDRSAHNRRNRCKPPGSNGTRTVAPHTVCSQL